jgi:hypothetical protein
MADYQRFSVFETIQAPDNDPVEIKWGSDLTPLQVAASVAAILAQSTGDQSALPPSVRVTLISVCVVAQ